MWSFNKEAASWCLGLGQIMKTWALHISWGRSRANHFFKTSVSKCASLHCETFPIREVLGLFMVGKSYSARTYCPVGKCFCLHVKDLYLVRCTKCSNRNASPCLTPVSILLRVVWCTDVILFSIKLRYLLSYSVLLFTLLAHAWHYHTECTDPHYHDNPYLHEKPLLFFTGNVTGKVRDNVVVEQGRSLLVLGFGPDYEDMSITHKSG